jgi:hypothetical protein
MSSMMELSEMDCRSDFTNESQHDMQVDLKDVINRQASMHGAPLHQWYYGNDGSMGKSSPTEKLSTH